MGCTLSMAGRSRASFSFRWYSASASCNRNKTITILFLCKSTFDNSLRDKYTVRRKRGEFLKFGTSWWCPISRTTCIGLEKEEGTILFRSNRNRFGNKDGQIQHTRPSFPFTWARERWKDGVWKGVNLSCFIVRTTSDKHISRTFQGFFKDKLQFSRAEI